MDGQAAIFSRARSSASLLSISLRLRAELMSMPTFSSISVWEIADGFKQAFLESCGPLRRDIARPPSTRIVDRLPAGSHVASVHQGVLCALFPDDFEDFARSAHGAGSQLCADQAELADA